MARVVCIACSAWSETQPPNGSPRFRLYGEYRVSKARGWKVKGHLHEYITDDFNHTWYARRVGGIWRVGRNEFAGVKV
jgi:hypothetical protein